MRALRRLLNQSNWDEVRGVGFHLWNGHAVQQSETKLCPLCGTLNHQRNRECFLCGWQGAFERDTQTLTLAWDCLSAGFGSLEQKYLTDLALGTRGAAYPLLATLGSEFFRQECRACLSHDYEIQGGV